MNLSVNKVPVNTNMAHEFSVKNNSSINFARKKEKDDSFEKTDVEKPVKEKASTGKKVGVGIASAVIPGLGQLINGQVGKGAAFFFGSIASAMIFPPIALGVEIWAIVDAVKNAKA